jgi:hypothetical protein
MISLLSKMRLHNAMASSAFSPDQSGRIGRPVGDLKQYCIAMTDRLSTIIAKQPETGRIIKIFNCV